MVNALTVDVEDYFHVQAFAEVISPSEWSRYPLRVETNTYRLLEMFGSRAIRATFFILGWVAEHSPKLVGDIFKAGHEIGCHGYSHQVIGHSERQEFREDIRRAKSITEDIIGNPIKCYRAPSYSITSQTLWALDELQKAGFESDSSIFPVVHDHYGIPNAPRFPHYRSLSESRRIVEFPPSTLQVVGMNLPVAGGGYFRLLPYSITAWAIHHINEIESQPAMFYLHPWEIDPDQPRIAAAWRSRFRHYQNLHSTEAKLNQLLDGFSWASMSDVLARSMGSAISHAEVSHGL